MYSQSEPIFVETKRGNKHLLLDGYRFYPHETKKNSTSWRCSYNLKTKCRCRAVTYDNKYITKRSKIGHNH